MLTFGEIRREVARYVGTGGYCPEHEEVERFAKKVMQYLLISGSYAGKRKVSLLAYKGAFSLPPEVEVPLKIKINRRVANLWDQWLQFNMATDEFEKCHAASEIVFEDGSQTPLAYPIPDGGALVGVRANCDEDSTILIQGKDTTGREIYTTHQGEQIPGVRLTLEKGKIKYQEGIVFGEITAVVKSRTNGYVTALAIPKTNVAQFLADWSPSEEKPMYRVFRINDRTCPPLVHVSMLCRVRLKDNYHDGENTFFDNTLAVEFAAQRLRSSQSNDVQTEAFKDKAVERILTQENDYKRINGSPLSVFQPLSGGAIKNIVR